MDSPIRSSMGRLAGESAGTGLHGSSRTGAEQHVLEAHARHELSEEQVRQLLGLKSRFDVHKLLQERGLYLDYSDGDLEENLKFSESWLSSQTPRH
jgi:hypothetical protein